MNTPQTNTAHWQELIEILNNVLDDRLGLTEGCREISRLSFALEPANPLFKPFIGYDSETDCFPLGEVRKHWQAEALLKTDLDRTVFEERHRTWIREASRLLLDYANRKTQMRS